MSLSKLASFQANTELITKAVANSTGWWNVQKEPEFWVVRGAPGVGKTALGKAIRSRFPSAAVVEVDSVRLMVSRPQWRSVKSQKLGLRLSVELVRSYLKEGFHPAVIIDTLPQPILTFLESELKAKPFVISLYARPGVLLERAKKRTEGFSDEETILEMNKGIMTRTDSEHELVLDTSDMKPDDVAAKVSNLMNSFRIER